MTNNITTPFMPQLETKATADLFDNWFDPVEAGLRDRAREFLQAMLEAELDEVLGRSRYVRRAAPARGIREDGGCRRSPPRPPVTLAARNVREDGGRGAACPANH
jgi:hypothetical protein